MRDLGTLEELDEITTIELIEELKAENLAEQPVTTFDAIWIRFMRVFFMLDIAAIIILAER